MTAGSWPLAKMNLSLWLRKGIFSFSARQAGPRERERERLPRDTTRPKASESERQHRDYFPFPALFPKSNSLFERCCAAFEAKEPFTFSVAKMRANPVIGYICMALLAIQFGLQPIVTQKFLSPETDTTLVVMVGELLKAVIALSLICVTNGFSRVVRGALIRNCRTSRAVIEVFVLSWCVILYIWCCNLPTCSLWLG